MKAEREKWDESDFTGDSLRTCCTVIGGFLPELEELRGKANEEGDQINRAAADMWRGCVAGPNGKGQLVESRDWSIYSGYAMAFCAMMNALDVDVTAAFSLGHAWNVVRMEDGNCYTVDVCWNDTDVTPPINRLNGPGSACAMQISL